MAAWAASAFGPGDGIDRVGQDDHLSLAVGVRDRIVGRQRRLADGVIGDVGEEVDLRGGSGIRHAMDADELDAGIGGLLQQAHIALRIHAGKDDAVRLQCDRLLQRPPQPVGRALPIDHRRFPAQLGRTLGDAAAPVGRGDVLGQIFDADDALVRRGRRTRRGAVPFVGRARGGLDRGEGGVDGALGTRRADADEGGDRERSGQQR